MGALCSAPGRDGDGDGDGDGAGGGGAAAAAAAEGRGRKRLKSSSRSRSASRSPSRSASRSRSSSRSALWRRRVPPALERMPARGEAAGGVRWRSLPAALADGDVRLEPSFDEGFDKLPRREKRGRMARLMQRLLREALDRGDEVVAMRMRLRALQIEHSAELGRLHKAQGKAQRAYAASDAGKAHLAAAREHGIARGRLVGAQREAKRAKAADDADDAEEADDGDGEDARAAKAAKSAAKAERRAAFVAEAEAGLEAAAGAAQAAADACPELAALSEAREAVRAREEELGMTKMQAELVRLQSRQGARSGKKGRGFEDVCVDLVREVHLDPAAAHAPAEAKRGRGGNGGGGNDGDGAAAAAPASPDDGPDVPPGGPFASAFAAVLAKYPHARLEMVPNVTVKGYMGEIDALLCAVVEATDLARRGKDGRCMRVVAVLCAYEFKANGEDVAHGYRTKDAFLRFLAGYKDRSASDKSYPDFVFTGARVAFKRPERVTYLLSVESFAPFRRAVEEDGTVASLLVFVTRPRVFTDVSSSTAGILVSAASAPFPPLALDDPDAHNTAERIDKLTKRVRKREAAGHLPTTGVLRSHYAAAGYGCNILIAEWMSECETEKDRAAALTAAAE